jgi:hypothetical protein
LYFVHQHQIIIPITANEKLKVQAHQTETSLLTLANKKCQCLEQLD